jgi:hypothetical protein
MATVTVKAQASIPGFRAGETSTVERTSRIDDFIEGGYLVVEEPEAASAPDATDTAPETAETAPDQPAADTAPDQPVVEAEPTGAHAAEEAPAEDPAPTA